MLPVQKPYTGTRNGYIYKDGVRVGLVKDGKEIIIDEYTYGYPDPSPSPGPAPGTNPSTNTNTSQSALDLYISMNGGDNLILDLYGKNASSVSINYDNYKKGNSYDYNKIIEVATRQTNDNKPKEKNLWDKSIDYVSPVIDTISDFVNGVVNRFVGGVNDYVLEPLLGFGKSLDKFSDKIGLVDIFVKSISSFVVALIEKESLATAGSLATISFLRGVGKFGVSSVSGTLQAGAITIQYFDAIPVIEVTKNDLNRTIDNFFDLWIPDAYTVEEDYANGNAKIYGITIHAINLTNSNEDIMKLERIFGIDLSEGYDWILR